MEWHFKDELKKFSDGEEGEKKTVAKGLMVEVSLLEKQRCAFCSGWGHAGNNCPTDFKLKQLRLSGGTASSIILDCRKKCRTLLPMKAITGFSQLRATPSKKRSLR